MEGQSIMRFTVDKTGVGECCSLYFFPSGLAFDAGLSWQGCCNKLPQTHTAENERDLFSHGSGGQKAKIKVSEGPYVL